MKTEDARAAARLEVWQHRFSGVCAEMGEALKRSSYSPNIKEREDFSCALFSPQGELVAQAEHIPVHLGSMATSVAAAIEAFPGMQPGDQVVVNDPFRGGTHLNDITFVTPVPGGLGYVANRAHHADVGGGTPGSLNAVAQDSVAEGLCIPPVRAIRAGDWEEDLRTILLANTRTPVERAGDLDAQWGANRLGVRRVAELADRHGARVVLGAMRDALDYGERRMRAALDGAGSSAVHAFTDSLEAADGDLVAVRVAVVIDGGELHADFAGSGTARPGVPCAVTSVTRSCLEYVIRCVTDPDIPRNGGASRLLRMTAPEGSVVNALYPTPVGAGNVEASQRVVDVLFGALAGVFPERVGAASQGTMNNLLIGGADSEGRPFVYYETIGGGQGGRPARPGQSGIHTHMTNTANTPIEALEAEFPLRVLRYGLRPGSGGSGAQPGGRGIERSVELLVPATVSLVAERRATRPWGLHGGGAGAPGRDDADGETLPAKSSKVFPAGTVVTVRTPGGGGYGAPPA